MSDTQATTWLTQEAYDKLKAELEQLSGPGRQEIATMIQEARDEGDLKENGGYHAAREEQGKMEARIRQLETLLRDAVVGSGDDAGEDVVAPGKVLTIKLGSMEQRFLLANREMAATTDLTIFGVSSPLGEALIGHRQGEKVAYTAPNGKDMTVEIVSVEAFSG